MTSRYKILVAFIIAMSIWLLYPLGDSLDDRPTSFILFDQDDKLLGARIADDGQWRFPRMDSVPNKFKIALLHFEDKDYYSHIGVDFTAILRATVQNIRHQKVVSGASTLTMQVIRLHYPEQPRSLPQKIKEILLAIRYDLFYTKEEILLDFATHAPFGGNVVGLETASWRYFDKAPSSMTWAESATLAVLPNAPGLIHPGRNRDALIAKRNRLLDRLLESQVIDSIEHQLSTAEPLMSKPSRLPNVAPHLLERLRKKNTHRYYSTIDKELQLDVADIIREHQVINTQKNIQNAAVIIIDNNSQEVISYHGNTEGRHHENYNDMIQRPRSTGSILKPLLYAFSIEDKIISPRQLATDIPISINGFSPKNYNHLHYGAVPYDKVIAKSLNVPSVNLLREYNVDRFLLDLKSLGFTTFTQKADYYGLPLILGGGEVNLWELSQCYSYLSKILHTYTSKSSQYDMNFKPKVTIKKGSDTRPTNYKYNPDLISASSIWHMMEAMLEVQRPNEEGQWEKFSSSKKIHWKTGTSYGNRDAWAIGMTPEYTVGVWIGNSDGEGQEDIIGVKAAGSVLFDVYNVLDVKQNFKIPYDDMIQLPICKSSGHIASQHCNDIEEHYVSRHVLSTERCPYHQAVVLNSKTELLAFQDCIGDGNLVDTSWFVLDPHVASYYKRYYPSYTPLPEFDSDCSQYNDRTDQMVFVYPKESSTLFLPKNMDGVRESCVIKASHKDSESTIYWHINGQYQKMTEDIHEISLDLSAGEYIITIQDQSGLKQSRKVEIIAED
jgi:penicillin-binding protein 1C